MYLFLTPTYNGSTRRSGIECSHEGIASLGAWEDSSGSNRRRLEVRDAAYQANLDNALVLRDIVNGTFNTHRVFHAGMNMAVPIANGGTGAKTAKAALNNLGIFYAATLPTSGTDGQICLVPV